MANECNLDLIVCNTRTVWCGRTNKKSGLTDASAKVGAFPFTTIDPNRATGE